MTEANTLATAAGMGNGEFNANFSNIRAVVIMCTALLLGKAGEHAF
jgi:hypothetical protein